MSIPAIPQGSSVSGCFGLGGADGFQYLTGEALLTYCQTQLRRIDTDINSFLDQQKRAFASKDALSKAKNAMSEAVPPTSAEQMANSIHAIQDAINSLPPGDPARTTLEGKLSEIKSAYLNDPDNPVLPTKDQWSSDIGDIEQAIDGVRGEAELNMIQLQAFMSQRQTVVQLTTNLMNKLDQTAQSIVKNI